MFQDKNMMWGFMAIFIVIILIQNQTTVIFGKLIAPINQLGKMLNNTINAVNVNGTGAAGQSNIPFTGTDVYDPTLYK